MATRLIDLTGQLTVCEPDERSFQISRGRLEHRGAVMVNGTSDQLKVAEPFDMVCAFEVLEHIEDDRELLRGWRDLVRPGGHVLLSVPAWQDKFGPWDEAVGHYRRYSPTGLTTLMSECGLRPVDVRLYGWPLANLMESVRNRLAPDPSFGGQTEQERTAGSGRLLQPQGTLAALAVSVGTLPFRGLQRLAPRRGNGIVALAQRV